MGKEYFTRLMNRTKVFLFKRSVYEMREDRKLARRTREIEEDVRNLPEKVYVGFVRGDWVDAIVDKYKDLERRPGEGNLSLKA